MKRLLFAVAMVAISGFELAPVGAQTPKPPLAPAASHAAVPIAGAAETALVKQYCTGCHNDRAKAGQLSLASFDAVEGRRERRDHREDDPQAARAA